MTLDLMGLEPGNSMLAKELKDIVSAAEFKATYRRTGEFLIHWHY